MEKGKGKERGIKKRGGREGEGEVRGERASQE